MGWMQKLYETHKAIVDMGDQAGSTLVPVSHTTAKAHVEIVLDAKGEFLTASVIPRPTKGDTTDESTTVMPCTEKSATRSGRKPCPHPLCDSLQFTAKDYRQYGGEVTIGYVDEEGEPNASYLKQLKAWVEAAPHPKTKAILAYVEQGNVVKNLVDKEILPLNAEGKLVKKKEGAPEAPIWAALTGTSIPEDAMIRWRVEIPGQPDSATWDDASLIANWAEYYPKSIEGTGMCMVLGEQNAALTILHPAKLRDAGDKAKLISTNDPSGFTFRGRFTDTDGQQACGVGYAATQKAHSALRCLIARQGYRSGSQVFVSWAVSGKDIPQPFDDSSSWADEDIVEADEALQESTPDHTVDIGQSFALRLNKYIAGYSASLTPTEDIVVMGLDSATPGRMSVIYYRELMGSEFLERLKNWHESLAWPQRHVVSEPGKKKGKGKSHVVWKVGAPIPRLIAEAAYGRDSITTDKERKLLRATIQRILPCIVDKRELPRDLVESCVRRAANRVGQDHWEWEQTLGVACALYKGFYARHHDPQERREYRMVLDPERSSRDYLYGRLLAIAERIEAVALSTAGESRPTNAARLMQRFADHPYTTWLNIRKALQPYLLRLQGRRDGFLTNMKVLMDEVHNMFNDADFEDDRRLDGEFLLGYHCQRQVWKKDKDTNPEPEGEDHA